MRLHKLTLKHFRAHESSDMSLAPGINLIHGPNGAGKTNVLEAAYYLCIGRSFVASRDAYALQFGKSFFDLRGAFEPEDRSPFEVRVVYKHEQGKRAFVNGAPLERLSELVGRVPVVVFAPGDYALTNGPPDERRRFIDNTLSQAKPAYLSELLKFRRTMKQRNALLARGKYSDPALLEPWNDKFSESAGKITTARAAFVAQFNRYMEEAYRMMEEISERPTITYRAFHSLKNTTTPEAIHDLHKAKMKEALPRERERRRSLVGPHRDDLVFKLDDMEVRRFASQGQHRTFGMALKLAKFLYLKSICNETPILLLDDVFGDLDPKRSAVFLQLLDESPELGQSLITSADEATLQNSIDFGDSRHSSHLIVKGSISKAYV